MGEPILLTYRMLLPVTVVSVNPVCEWHFKVWIDFQFLINLNVTCESPALKNKSWHVDPGGIILAFGAGRVHPRLTSRYVIEVLEHNLGAAKTVWGRVTQCTMLAWFRVFLFWAGGRGRRAMKWKVKCWSTCLKAIEVMGCRRGLCAEQSMSD